MSRHGSALIEEYVDGIECTVLVSENPDDAARLELGGGDGAEVAGEALEVVLDASQVPGSAGFSAGYPATLSLRSGQWTKVGRAENWQRAPELIHRDRGETP